MDTDLHPAIAAVKHGGVIAYPTEAVFGLGCDPTNDAALQKLIALKQRPADKGFILIASEWSQLVPFVAPLTEAQLTTLFDTWPGPVTWLVPAAASVSPLLRGDHATIAVRITAHPIAHALCQQLQSALVSTSANLNTQAPLKTATEVQQVFGNQLDWIVNGNVGNLIQPTQIRDLLTLQVIR